jgi:hypothetical protein
MRVCMVTHPSSWLKLYFKHSSPPLNNWKKRLFREYTWIHDYVSHVFQLIKNEIDKMPIDERPIHCIKNEDERQKILHIRHDNKWETETFKLICCLFCLTFATKNTGICKMKPKIYVTVGFVRHNPTIVQLPLYKYIYRKRDSK